MITATEIKNYSYEVKKLLIKSMVHALREVEYNRHKLMTPSKQASYKEACAFLSEDNETFKAYCGFIEVNPQYMLKMLFKHKHFILKALKDDGFLEGKYENN